MTTTTISLGTWNHYTVTFNANSGGLKIYENGIETVSRDDLASYPILKAGYQVFGQVYRLYHLEFYSFRCSKDGILCPHSTGVDIKNYGIYTPVSITITPFIDLNLPRIKTSQEIRGHSTPVNRVREKSNSHTFLAKH